MTNRPRRAAEKKVVAVRMDPDIHWRIGVISRVLSLDIQDAYNLAMAEWVNRYANLVPKLPEK